MSCQCSFHKIWRVHSNARCTRQLTEPFPHDATFLQVPGVTYLIFGLVFSDADFDQVSAGIYHVLPFANRPNSSEILEAGSASVTPAVGYSVDELPSNRERRLVSLLGKSPIDKLDEVLSPVLEFPKGTSQGASSGFLPLQTPFFQDNLLHSNAVIHAGHAQQRRRAGFVHFVAVVSGWTVSVKLRPDGRLSSAFWGWQVVFSILGKV